MELNKTQKGQEHNVVNKSVDTVDRTSQLPQVIIHGILSFLPTKDAVKTSVLSKTWLRSWSSFPNFDFDEKDFLLLLKRTEKFMNFINDSLQRCLEQDLNINKFRLCLFSLDIEMISRIDRWVSIAMKRNVKEFYLEIHPRETGLRSYNLPQTVFDNTTLTVLKVSGCNLKPYRDIKLSHLQKLCLDGDYIDEQFLENITSCCPSIKDLSLKYSPRLKYLQVSSVLHLNTIKVYSCEGLEQIKIVTLSLQIIRCGSWACQCEIDLKACEILKELKFVEVNIKDELLQDFSSKFPNLEVLVLNSCHSLKSINISSQKLKRLVLRRLKLAEIRIDTPNLIALEYLYNGICFYSIHTPKLKEVELAFRNRNPQIWYYYSLSTDEMKIFLGKFANVNGLMLVIRFKETVIIHEDLKGITLLSQENFQKLDVYITITSMKLSDLLEKLTSMTLPDPLRNISIVTLSDSKLLKNLYEEPRSFVTTHERRVSLEEIDNFDGVENVLGASLKLYEKMQYKTTTFRVRGN